MSDNLNGNASANSANATPDATAGQNQADWTTGFDEDTKGYVQTKGFKDSNSVVGAYRNLEKLMGAPKERLLKLPEKADDVAGWDAVYSKLGRPSKAEDYGIKLADEKAAKEIADAFHKHGVSKSAVEDVMGKYAALSSSAVEAEKAAKEAKYQAEESSLKTEWGMAYEKNVNIGKLAASKFGIDDKTLDALQETMGYSGVMKLMQQIGSGLGEDAYVSNASGNGFGVMSPAQANHRIAALSADKDFASRLMSGDVKAKAEWEKLHVYAVG